MSKLDDLKFMLLLPPLTPQKIKKWLETVSANLKGFSPQPCVVRCSVGASSDGSREVRRWSEDTMLSLMGRGGVSADVTECLYLSSDGRLMFRFKDGQRILRNKPEDRIYDDIFVFQEIPEPTAEQLQYVQKKVVGIVYPLGYSNWNALGLAHKKVLVQNAGSWQNASAALALCTAEEKVEALQLFLSNDAVASLRLDVLQAGFEGSLRPGADVLTWLLSQPNWNLNQSLVAMSKSAASDEPNKVWKLTSHPNVQIRLRLTELFDSVDDLLRFLAKEQDQAVRASLLLCIERRVTPKDLASRLKNEKDQKIKEALFWCAANWRTGIYEDSDWDALNTILTMKMDKKNRKLLKDKLFQHGQLSLRNRILS